MNNNAQIDFNDYEEELETEKTPFLDEIYDLMRGPQRTHSHNYVNSNAFKNAGMRERILFSIREYAKFHMRKFVCTNGPWHDNCFDKDSIIASGEEVKQVIDELRNEGFAIESAPGAWIISW